MSDYNNATTANAYLTSAGQANAAEPKQPILHHTITALQVAVEQADKIAAQVVDSHQQHFGSVVETLAGAVPVSDGRSAPENTADTIRRLTFRLRESLSRLDSMTAQLVARL